MTVSPPPFRKITPKFPTRLGVSLSWLHHSSTCFSASCPSLVQVLILREHFHGTMEGIALWSHSFQLYLHSPHSRPMGLLAVLHTHQAAFSLQCLHMLSSLPGTHSSAKWHTPSVPNFCTISTIWHLLAFFYALLLSIARTDILCNTILYLLYCHYPPTRMSSLWGQEILSVFIWLVCLPSTLNRAWHIVDTQ